MGLIPDLIAGQSPRRANADKEIAFGFANHETDQDKKQTHRGQE